MRLRPDAGVPAMTVHVGEITSEVVATGNAGADRGGGDEVSVWEERRRMEAALQRLAVDRARTATGHGHD